MSAPLRMDPEQLRNLAAALEQLNEITKKTGVDFSSFGQLSATVGDSNIRIAFKDGIYVVDDMNGY